MSDSLYPKEEETLRALSSDCSETLKLAKVIISKVEALRELPPDLYELIHSDGVDTA